MRRISAVYVVSSKEYEEEHALPPLMSEEEITERRMAHAKQRLQAMTGNK